MEKIICKARSTRKENGDILVLFAGMFIIIVFCLALVIDIGMVYLRRNEMQDICQVIRKDRFTYEDSVRYAENPAEFCYKEIYSSAVDNGFDGNVKVYFNEEEPVNNKRSYKTRTVLTEKYKFSFAKILGFNEMDINVSIDVDETYGEGMADMIWHSKKSVSSYNGSYTNINDGSDGFVYTAGDIPSDW